MSGAEREQERNLEEIRLVYRSHADVQWLLARLDAERAALTWMRHLSMCLQCRDDRQKCCERGNGIFSALVDACQEPLAASSTGAGGASE